MADEPPDPPSDRPERAAPDGRKRVLLGGLPGADDAPPKIVTTPKQQPRPERASRRPPGWLTRFIDPEDLAGLDSLPESAQAGLSDLVRRSPPLTVSVSLHVLVILALTLWTVRDRKPERPTLDLSFATPVIVEDERPDPGVTVVPEKVEEPEPEPEVVKSEDPPVEEVAAAPPQVETVEVAPGQATQVEATAPAIGTLLDGREEGRRDGLLAAFGGSDKTEAAVALALQWLVRQQDKRDGLWSLQGPFVDGAPQDNRLAATALALLALQGAGNTPEQGRHRTAVARAWRSLLNRQLAEGNFDIAPMPTQQALYAHAQATIALCELYGMTRKPIYEQAARRALAYAVAAQGPAGGWRYEPGKGGDMSVTGWYVMALKSGQMAGLDVPAPTFAAVTGFLDGVALDGGSRYGYVRDSPDTPPRQVTAAVTAEGLLCRQYLGWPRKHPALVIGLSDLVAHNRIEFAPVERVIEFGAGGEGQPSGGVRNAYAWYYITQVAHHFGGDPWRRWNETMRESLPAAQVKKGPEAGSWDPAFDQWGHVGGRLYMTCFCTFMLEVYYRHLPLYGDEAIAGTAAADPER
jgi:hypothetical protein